MLGVVFIILTVMGSVAVALLSLGVGIALSLVFYTAWALYRGWKVRAFHRTHRHSWVINDDWLIYQEEDGVSAQMPFKEITNARMTHTAFSLRSERGGIMQYPFSDFSSA